METRLRGVPSEGFEKLCEDLERTAEHAADPFTRSFSIDFIDLLQHSESIAARVNNTFEARATIDIRRERSPVTSSYAGNIALRAVHKNLMYQEGYPHTHAEPGTWRETIADTVESEDFHFTVSVLDVMSNIPRRYSTLKVLGEKLRKRVGRPLSVLDIGASQNHGLKILASGHTFMPPHRAGVGMSAFARYLEAESDYGEMIGLDQWNAETEPIIKQWARGCSLPPQEMVDDKRVRQYDYLDSLRPPNVSMFSQTEIGTKLFDEDLTKLGGRFDIVFMSTIVYQMSREKFAKAFEQAKKCLTPGGIIVIQDHIVVNGETFFYIDNWKDEHVLPYRTSVYDSAHPERGLTEVFQFSNGRLVRGRVAGLKGLATLRRLEH